MDTDALWNEAKSSNTVEEAVIFSNGRYEVRVPGYPAHCSYVRVVDKQGNELLYWDSKEWVESPMEVMGAVMGAVQSIWLGERLQA